MYTRGALFSALWIAALAEPLFRHPLITDAAEVVNLSAAQPCPEHGDGAGNTKSEDHPVRDHASSLRAAAHVHCPE